MTDVLGPLGPIPGARDLLECTRLLSGAAPSTPSLRPDQFDRYSRQLLPQILGLDGQQRLLAARVLVVGAGGLGSPVLQYLAAAGVGHLSVVDDDVVTRSNLHRQVIHRDADAAGPGREGLAKVDSAVRMVRDLNPDIEITGLRHRVGPDTIDGLLAHHDVVVDGTDNFPTRYLIADACAHTGVPLVWGSVLGFDAQVSVFWSRPPSSMAEGARTLRDLFPNPPAPGQVSSCAEAGVVGAVVGIAGSFMAMEVVKLVTGTGTPLMGRVLVVDALEGETRTLPFQARPRAQRFSVPVAVPANEGAPVCAGVPVGDDPTVGGRLDDAGADGLTVAEAADLLAARPDTVVVDVREDRECAQGVIAGAVCIPLAKVLDGSGLDDLDRHATTLVYCAAGVRSALALAALRARGWSDATHLMGGVHAWEDAGRALVRP